MPGLHVAALAAVVAVGGVAGELAGGGELGRHVGQVVADGLVLPDRLAEALPLLGVPQRILQRGRRHAERARRDLNASGLKAFHHLRETLARLAAEDRRRGHAAVVERQLAGLDALVAQLGQIPRHRQPWPVLHEHHRDALVLGRGRRVGLAQQRDQTRPAGVADPRLGTVDHQIGAVGRSAVVVMFCRSDPPPGSVSAIVARISPVAIAGRYVLLLLLGAEQRPAAWRPRCARPSRRPGSSSRATVPG